MASNYDPQSIEAQIVLTKTTAKKHKGTRELLTTAEMQKRGIPIEKIRAVVAKGQGVPDVDCPDIASLTRFWINTSTKEIDLDETRQQGQITIQASAQGAVDGLMTPFASSAATLGADGMQSILQNLGTTPAPPEGLWVGFELLFGFPLALIFFNGKFGFDLFFLNCKPMQNTSDLFQPLPPLLLASRRCSCRPYCKSEKQGKSESKSESKSCRWC